MMRCVSCLITGSLAIEGQVITSMRQGMVRCTKPKRQVAKIFNVIKLWKHIVDEYVPTDEVKVRRALIIALRSILIIRGDCVTKIDRESVRISVKGCSLVIYNQKQNRGTKVSRTYEFTREGAVNVALNLADLLKRYMELTKAKYSTHKVNYQPRMARDTSEYWPLILAIGRSDKWIKANTIQGIVKRAMSVAEIKGYIAHELKHAVVSMLYKQ